MALDGLARDDLAADRGLDRDLEHVRGIRSFSFSHIARPRCLGAVRWTIIESASTGSSLTRIDILTRSPSR
jgi:hypothetical protein